MRAKDKRFRFLSTLNSQLSTGLHLLPAFTAPECFRGAIGPWEVVSSYSSATAPDSHGISCADSLFRTHLINWDWCARLLAGGWQGETKEHSRPAGAG